MSRITPYLFFFLMVSGSVLFYLQHQEEMKSNPSDVPQVHNDMPVVSLPPFTQASTVSGAYLATRYAQQHFEWRAAGSFLKQVLHDNPNDSDLLKRAMILAMGSGEVDKALSYAKKSEEIDGKPSALSKMFLAVGAFKEKNYQSAAAHVQNMPEGGLSDFILPLLKGWSDAALRKDPTQALDQNTIHLYHAILIDDFLGKTGRIEGMLLKALNVPDMNAEDIARIADLYAHIGNIEQAKKLYTDALNIEPENFEIAEKLADLESGKQDELFVHITTPEDGVAEAMYDMGRLLAQEYSDETARIFVEMALYLNPQLTKARFLQASMAARNERYEDAIAAYRSVAADDVNYNQARRLAAAMLSERGDKDSALAELEDLAHNHNDVDAMIQIGDIYRADENFKEAIKAYSEAQKMMGGTIGPDYWQVLYVRGMAYEQNGQWAEAEKDLKAALAMQPSHPYILNYLGYAWADQGVHLNEALEMIEKAVNARPDDGYITDSLGWVFYKMGKYEDAVPYLEQAVELMPYDATINDHLGDAYWTVGRRREARFQWERAKNHSEDPKQIEGLETKILEGLPEFEKTETQPSSLTSESVAKQNADSSRL